MDKKYFVIKNRGEHSAHIQTVDMDDIWSNSNPGGWTYQDISGPHGHADGPYDDLATAEEEMKDWLKCPRAEAGEYCYTHNPYPTR